MFYFCWCDPYLSLCTTSSIQIFLLHLLIQYTQILFFSVNVMWIRDHKILWKLVCKRQKSTHKNNSNIKIYKTANEWKCRLVYYLRSFKKIDFMNLWTYIYSFCGCFFCKNNLMPHIDKKKFCHQFLSRSMFILDNLHVFLLKLWRINFFSCEI